MPLARLTAACLIVTWLVCSGSSPAADVSWLPYDPASQEIDGLAFSADGQSIAGEMWTGTPGTDRLDSAFVAHGATIIPIGTLFSGDIRAAGTALSADGTIVVGHSYGERGPWRAFRWTASDGMIDLGHLSGGQIKPTAVSDDGSVVIGIAHLDDTGHQGDAFRWTAATGMRPLLDNVALGALYSTADDVSMDGSVIVGSFTTREGLSAFRWTENEGTVVLPELLGGRDSAKAQHILTDGTIVGVSHGDLKFQGVAWRTDGSLQGIPGMVMPDGFPTPFAISGISDDFKTAVLAQGNTYLWTQSQGVRNINEVLHDDFGLGTESLFETIFGVSADGTRLAGLGKPGGLGFSSPWIATLTPPPLAADANFDGQVDLSDFGALKRYLGRGGSSRPYRRYGNFDGDLDVDMDDFGVLKATFGDKLPTEPMPEPSALLLMAAGVVCLSVLWRRETPRSRTANQVR